MLLSLLDNDLYKFTMQQAVLKLYPDVKVKYKFVNRGKHKFPKNFGSDLYWILEKMQGFELEDVIRPYELKDICPYFSNAYLDFLRGYKYNPNEVTVKQVGSNLDITIEGHWYRTILWEVPLMAIISELYLKDQRIDWDYYGKANKLKAKFFNKNKIKFADFGTRRRMCSMVHTNIPMFFKEECPDNFLGTSNIHMAVKHEVRPIGTQAHEWFMFHAAKYGFRMANTMALEKWVEVYKGDLGIALSDTYTTDNFLKAFNMYYAKLFDGVRQDSGDPITFINKMINHYQKMGIDTSSKTMIFSDGLDISAIDRIETYIKTNNIKIKRAYGIGTNLTNDVGIKPMNMVVKLFEVKLSDQDDWRHCIKLSDDEGKITGNPEIIKQLNYIKKEL